MAAASATSHTCPSSDPEDAVAGSVFAITDAEPASADDYEVDDYARVEATLRSGANAWVYLDARTTPAST